MSAAANIIMKAIHQRLAGDAALAAMIGSDGITDRLLPRPNLPCVVFGEIESRDYSAGDQPAEEHFLSIEAWSEAEGRRQVADMSARLRELLHDQPLALSGATLVNMLVTSTRTRREPKTRFFVADMRLRVVTE